MTLLDRLRDAAANVPMLERFILNNAEEIHDWFSLEPQTFIKSHHREIRHFTLLKWNVLRKLDPTSEANLAFIALLLDVCERISDSACFLKCYELLRTTPFNIGSRLNASVLFMVNVNTDVDYLDRFDQICELLKTAYEEEDIIERVLSTMVNYYAQVVNDFGEFNKAAPALLKARIEEVIRFDEHSFLNHPLIFSVLDIDIADHKIAYSQIHYILDEYLDREVHHPDAEIGLLKEEDTEYAVELEAAEKEFSSIRTISVKHHMANPDAERAFRLLLSGTAIVDDENLLFAYMHSLGMMHAEKLLSAFPFVGFDALDGDIGVVDWGCGQGMGSMVLMDHILRGGLSVEIVSFTLIEPSAIALKRASLHTDKYNCTTRLTTINKLINNLAPEDFIVKEKAYIHLFSNILDIETISLGQLTKLIKNTFSGTNYFVCVGPYQNDPKRARLDTFMNSFSSMGFVKYAEENDRAYEWRGDKKWTRLVRVFSAEL